MRTFADRKLILRARWMTDDVVKLVDGGGHTSCTGHSGGILDGIAGRRREDTAYLLSAPGET